jgi:hypothetical protein
VAADAKTISASLVNLARHDCARQVAMLQGGTITTSFTKSTFFLDF